MAEPPIAQERAEASADRRAAVYWQSVAKQNPSQAAFARSNARDAAAEARSEDRAADRQENSVRRGRAPRL